MRVLPYGPRALLVELDDLDTVMSSSTQWRSAQIPGVIDVVPAARTILVVHDGTLDPNLLVPVSGPLPIVETEVVEIPVAYDGEDLDELAAETGLDVATIIVRHTSALYRVAFCGFSPGFAYLVGLPVELHVTRRSTPRERVDAGSVAIADGYSGIYPRRGPGGWRLLGHTDVVLWDESRTPPALLTPGAAVRFVAR
ncbi:MAG: 5-oxoprolinase subunit B family protein [Ilumatobacteraceae bacterium]